MNEIKIALKEIVNKFGNWIYNNYDVLTGWIIYIYTLITMILINDNNRVKTIILYFVVVFVLLLINKTNEIMTRNKKGFPNVNKRFTKKIDNELVMINKSEWQEAILYLYEIENYLGK